MDTITEIPNITYTLWVGGAEAHYRLTEQQARSLAALYIAEGRDEVGIAPDWVPVR